MTYNKKRALSYGGILISVLLAYFCRLVRPENVFMRNLADQCRNCIYLGMYCAWVIYLEKHVVHRKTRRCLTAIGCLMVFWFFVRTVKFHILHDPLGEHICWYLYYIPMILIPVLGLAAAMFLGEKDGEKTGRKIIVLLFFAVIMIVCVFTNDLHQLVFRFSGRQPPSGHKPHHITMFIKVKKNIRNRAGFFRPARQREAYTDGWMSRTVRRSPSTEKRISIPAKGKP